MERQEAGKWTERVFKITEGKLSYLTAVSLTLYLWLISPCLRFTYIYLYVQEGKELGSIPLDSSTWVFARPEKDNRKHIFGLLNVCNGKSIVLEVSVSTSEIKDEWIAALKAANVTYSTPRRSLIAKDGTPSKADEKFCGTFTSNSRGDGEQKDCQCTVS